MAESIDGAKGAAEADAASDDRFNRLVASLGGTATASAVFGDPVEKGGVTIVPVARVRLRRRRRLRARPARKKKRDEGGEDQVGYGQGGGAQARRSATSRSRRRGAVQAHRRPRAAAGRR